MKLQSLPSLPRICLSALLGASLLAPKVYAQVAIAGPLTVSLNVSTGGTVSTTVTAATAPGMSPGMPGGPGPTDNRQANANQCSALIGSVGVNTVDPCAPSAVFGIANVGAQPSSLGSQTYSVSYTAGQLSAIASMLATAGQPFGSRKFYIVTTYSGALPARYVAIQVNLIEPVAAGITAASSNLLDVAINTPTSVPVRYTLAGTDAPLAGQFCSALTIGYPANGVAASNPCAVGSNLGLSNAAIGFNVGALQTGEILPVPGAIALQAAQRAQATGNSIFYFVRQFNSGKFAVVQLRLNGTAPNAGINLSELSLGFKDGNVLQNIGFFKRGQILPPVIAKLRYQGAGILRARWEVIQPGDTPLNLLDLTPEASLTPLERTQQHRYRVLDRVNVYLPVTGQAVIAGPVPRLLPNEQYGMYQLVLRIEAVPSIDGFSAANAAFTLPVLRYYIGESRGPSYGVANKVATQQIELVAPANMSTLAEDKPASFQWQINKGLSIYRLELEANGKLVYAARVKAAANEDINRYSVPAFIMIKLRNTAARWRVVALASDGRFAGESEWRELNSGQ